MNNAMNFEISPAAKTNYILRRVEDLESCKAAFSKDDFDTIRKIGHRIKGNGSTFGFAEISTLGATLEDAALSKDKGTLSESISYFSDWVAQHVPSA